MCSMPRYLQGSYTVSELSPEGKPARFDVHGGDIDAIPSATLTRSIINFKSLPLPQRVPERLACLLAYSIVVPSLAPWGLPSNWDKGFAPCPPDDISSWDALTNATISWPIPALQIFTGARRAMPIVCKLEVPNFNHALLPV